tara:strand:- start:968 stop:1303 length:336 start_codon:yes stop_codon:yes gene_type:complete
MKKSEIINKIHSSGIVYLLSGWIFESQRKYLVFFLPTVQFQFLVNDNQCLMTQLERYYLIQEKQSDTTEIIYDSFVEKKLKEWGINIQPKYRECLINSGLYCSFLISYWLM